MGEDQPSSEPNYRSKIATELDRIFAGNHGTTDGGGVTRYERSGRVDSREATLSQATAPNIRLAFLGIVNPVDGSSVMFSYSETANDLKTTRFHPSPRMQVDEAGVSEHGPEATIERLREESPKAVADYLVAYQQEEALGLHSSNNDDWQEFVSSLQSFIPEE